MAMTPRLDQRQSQTLVMTPQLQQAIKLLQLSNLDLALDEIGELEIGELQQLDRLLQLRRHDQELGLTQVEPRGKRHLGRFF